MNIVRLFKSYYCGIKRSKMRNIVVFSLFILFSTNVSAKLFKYTDKYGVHYVDSIEKIPKKKRYYVKNVQSAFRKTGIKLIDKYRYIIQKQNVYYKELENQKSVLIAWCNLMIDNKKPYLISELKSIKSINLKLKKKKRQNARKLALHFKILESEWPEVYERLNFKSTGNSKLDTLRKNYKKNIIDIKNLSKDITLVERWASMMEFNKKTNKKLIKERLKKLSNLFDIPKPDKEKVKKYLKETVRLFEIEYNK